MIKSIINYMSCITNLYTTCCLHLMKFLSYHIDNKYIEKMQSEGAKEWCKV